MSETSTPVNHFIRQIIRDDLANGKHTSIVTRFPPEPNGYLHIGHAKAICLNFGMAAENKGRCNLRFDDTNPSKEDMEFVHSIQADIQWLGFEWSELRHASDYFEVFYQCALKLIGDGKAYVCDLTAEQVREYRGTLTEPGRNSPNRERSVEENLKLFQGMRAGEFADGSRTLRAKIDMASPNINLRDPAIYRIRKIPHQNTGDAWPIYPMYDYAHCISDALEGITHSLCTLEFEDHRPLYDWCLAKIDLPHHPDLYASLIAAGVTTDVSTPQQIEFSRLNLDYTVMSKRKLKQMVDEKLVDGWDDPRMPTLSGFRRRGYTPASIRELCERIGVTKQVSVIEYSVLEGCVREDLDAKAPRRMAVLNPIKLLLTNLPENHHEKLVAPNHPQHPEMGTRDIAFSREVWIERDDFQEIPEKGFHRLKPDGEVRLRFVGIVKCEQIIKDANGEVIELHGTLDPTSRHGMEGSSRKVKGTIHWVSAADAIAAEVRVYDRLFTEANPDAGDADFKLFMNPDSRNVIEQAWLEASLANAKPEENFQFERLGYFVADRIDHTSSKPVFNRSVGLRDTWAKQSSQGG